MVNVVPISAQPSTNSSLTARARLSGFWALVRLRTNAATVLICSSESGP
ncbi:Uncharacterised protein [Mycobacterium tuberculosis]|uniref:Uncharacterized protein n=1 Tax=Mycobacterium tuberculosis TaxID=1773 RepID=A0A0U0RT40_MYCTX|nr:Uncharacterised protein [Mycobacterium tuberculosis]CFS40004.1 Uncharacterised protein [Mycobacterium tuberculosis]CKR51936.1 Uncharacterised protein [Mycobacterium tuberculosis]COW24716.1 Uncharacterised protein [Mycobacterium tuberculosis]COW90094.1 Uncharacterised protein [Mycobacterium tuberculosis]